ncbi:DUF3043 domain-containing protein [Nocardioides sp. Kera G14]|uniref:DUF3043 domain-containing protein n=1 Tax=Nocardioides sp. Kera G14 TaxID=2884264 RepID=UPI001D126F11|nr:DUF3043 domain-containing protein [Nocardioides sp. Kera G14]UDY22561.1 DUF3043 domain-containing protein [Nocardioides sp. Kera G14]
MFGRKSAPAPTETSPTGGETSIMPKAGSAGGKGRPTPTRKEAEAARLAKVRTPRTRKEAAAAERARRFESSAKMREAMKTGDERYLPARDKGPVRRFVRDYVDSRFTVAELILPLLVVTLIIGAVGGRGQLAVFANMFMLLLLVATAGNLVIISLGLRRQLIKRWPDVNRRGLTYYACVRTLQMRFLRMPKPQVRMGQQLPDSYR